MEHLALYGIVAVELPGLGIGLNGKDLYKISADRKYFSEHTTGGIVVMGRVTWDGIPSKYKPLPDRKNVVISSTLSQDEVPEGVSAYSDWKEAVRTEHALNPNVPIFIIGGGTFYRATLPYLDRLFVTEISGKKGGDVFFPDYQHWPVVKESVTAVTDSGIPYAFKVCANPNKKDLL